MTTLEALQRVINLSYIQNDWDGYGGIPPLPRVVEVAKRLLMAVPEPPDDIYPNPHGTISIEWIINYQEAWVECGKDTFNLYWEGCESYLADLEYDQEGFGELLAVLRELNGA